MNEEIPRKRLGVLMVGFLVAFSLITFRLFYWQGVMGRELAVEAQAQYSKGRILSAPRGNIISNDGSWLAAREQAWLVYSALPDIEIDTSTVADRLAPLFIEPEEGDDEYKLLVQETSRLKELLGRDDVVWVPLMSKVNSDIKYQIEEMGIKGIGFDPVEDRIYPESSAAAHLLGFVGKDEEGSDIGYFGLEGYYDLVLSGKPGFVLRDSDARGVPILGANSKEISAFQGVDLVTHIDKAIQISLEQRLVEGIEKYGAVSGTGIVMDPKTGSILAMSSYPAFDPSSYSEFENIDFVNPAITFSFEPGSIFKVLIMASALDTKEIKVDTKCDICAAPVKVDKYFIRTWNNEYREGTTMLEVIVNSDNVGMVFAGRKLGIDRMYDYLKSFGIGELTGVDLQGEATPKVREKKNWSEVDLATASFGQGIAVTPMQMIRAVGVIANDGVITVPQVVDEIKGDSFREDIAPITGERVISKEAARDITAMMVEAAENGEAKWTYREGFGVAGKTGTAQIPIDGNYDEDKTIASYIGFAPYDDPKFIMLITLREPQSSPWASETAAPLWYDIAEDLFLYFGMQPEGR